MKGLVRGCGTRKQAGIYLEVPTSPNGKPLEHFLIDPPIPIDPAALGLSPRGVTPIERDGAWHVLDWIGSEHYPNVADFLEEVRRFGLSRRIPRTFPFERLTLESRILCVHARAVLRHPEQYRAAIVEEGSRLDEGRVHACPKGLPVHEMSVRLAPDPDQTPPAPNDIMCAGLWWQDLDPKTCELVLDPLMPRRRACRQMPSFTYTASRRPEGIDASARPGIFASLPAWHLVVIRDRDGGRHEDAVQRASRAGIPVHVEDE